MSEAIEGSLKLHLDSIKNLLENNYNLNKEFCSVFIDIRIEDYHNGISNDKSNNMAIELAKDINGEVSNRVYGSKIIENSYTSIEVMES